MCDDISVMVISITLYLDSGAMPVYISHIGNLNVLQKSVNVKCQVRRLSKAESVQLNFFFFC